MPARLTEEIVKRADAVRFHTPSYAGIDLGLQKCDVTELPYTDNLLCPTSALAELEKELASAYKAEACFISTQGATFNLFQAVYACLPRGAFLLVGKLHASVYNAMRHFGATAYHVDALTEVTTIPGDVGTVILTSPDYFGRCAPLQKIYPYLHEKGIALLVDSAHGGHFVFSKELPVSASEYSDLAVLSLHKTLPVMTGGSVLCVQNEYALRADVLRKTMHSTSPSFAVLCSIEKAVADFTRNGEEYYAAVLKEVRDFKRALKAPFVCDDADDETRLTVRSPYDGESVYTRLLEKGFVAEMAYENGVTFIVNPYNYRHLPTLCAAFDGLTGKPYEKKAFPTASHPIPTRLSYGGEFEAIEVENAVGRRAYLEVGFYPPGVPCLYSHDVITAEHAAMLKEPNAQKYVFGLERGKILVVK